jgi:hemerythrin-like domain-containing protein
VSRALNVISHLIHLAKKAKQQLTKGKVSSTKRVLQQLMRFEEWQLRHIRAESGSEELETLCRRIVADTKEALRDATTFKVAEAEQLLDRVIALEQQEIKPVQARQGLSHEVLATVDPYIRKLVHELNRLSFVRQTTHSCSGHFPMFPQPSIAYFSIKYDWQSPTSHNIGPFHRDLLRIVAEAGIIRPLPGTTRGQLVRVHDDISGVRETISYYLGFPLHGPARSEWREKHRILKQWDQIYRLVRKYEDRDALEHRRKDMHVTKDERLVGQPQGAYRGVIIKCPRCGAEIDSKSRCRNCGFLRTPKAP